MSQTGILKSFFRLIYSHRCYACERELISQEKHVCFSCLSQIPETNFHLHPQDNEFYYRLGGRVKLEGAMALFYFDKKGKLQSLIEALKYKSSPQLGRFLGAYYAHRLKEESWIEEIKAIVPIPLHPRKKVQRGYNQAEELAIGLGEILEKAVEKNFLKRVRYTRSQTRMGGNRRWENVKDAFRAGKDLNGPILLIDDVLTTGATFEAAMQALLLQETDLKIYTLSIGIARKH
ncbi:MAG: ComF family protein [Bacteroidia bacterium]|nr:ComF family protein [Bacteroidia bacterium]